MNKLLKFLIYTAVVSLILLGLMIVIFNIPKRFKNEIGNQSVIEKVDLTYHEINLPVDTV